MRSRVRTLVAGLEDLQASLFSPSLVGFQKKTDNVWNKTPNDKWCTQKVLPGRIKTHCEHYCSACW